MIKKYCQNCGSKMEYRVEDKPKFCSKCGISLLASSKKALPSGEPDLLQPELEEEETEENFSFESLSSLDCDITHFEKPKVTVGDIMGTAAAGGTKAVDDSEERASMRDPNYTPEAFMEEFSKEAGTGRNKRPNETRKKES